MWYSLSSGRDVGTKVADEDVGAANILDAKSPGVGIAENENLSDCEDFPPENFPPGGMIHCKTPTCLAWRRCHLRMMIYFCRFLQAP